MPNKLLNLKLFYQGKVLDIARYGRDFTTKLVIGSNKYLAWQILDPKFPDKHLFLISKGGNFYLRLPDKTELSCKKADQGVDKDYLKKNNILKGNELLLTKDMVGTITLGPQWAVGYEYAEPRVTVWTAEQKQIISQYSRRPKLTDFEKKNLWIMILVTVIAFLIMLTADLLTDDQVQTYDLTSRLKDYNQTAQSATITPQSTLTQEDVKPDAKGKEVAKTVTSGTATKGTGLGDKAGYAKSKFGMENFDPNATSKAQVVQYDYTERLVATSRGGGGNRGGSGPGSGSSGDGSGGVSGLKGAKGTTFDPNDIAQEGTGYAAVVGSGVQGTSLRPTSNTNITKYTAGMGKLVPIGSPAQLSAAELRMKSQYTAGSVKARTEDNIAEAPEEERSQLSNIAAVVKAKQSQIQSAFNEASVNQEMYGTLLITLLINESGKVDVVEVKVQSGKFYDGFLESVKERCYQWKFRSGTKQRFDFTQIFRK
ncbi:MAG: hypothetical protein CVU48_00190 [Candidatus Cloacimonetes bacterium HGW-Cloacimonetes-1]|jgi:hypothetical protein|nr:MAG: hypothetical protein CVU48_00190 [Candidatus Cloacimonetes bacterium HGW-Cloacimonetes-1]